MGFKVASRVRGLSDEAFREAFGTEEQCRSALVRLRWPGGFVCPCCGHREHCVLAGRGLYQCNRCKKQTSPTAGTIFHATKLPQTLWFAAIHLIVTAKNRHLVGGTRPPSRGQAAGGLGREAQDHGGDGAARGGDGAYGGGSRWTKAVTPFRRSRRRSWRCHACSHQTARMASFKWVNSAATSRAATYRKLGPDHAGALPASPGATFPSQPMPLLIAG